MVNNLTERELKILSYLIDEDDFRIMKPGRKVFWLI